jgi:hypothetical protein
MDDSKRRNNSRKTDARQPRTRIEHASQLPEDVDFKKGNFVHYVARPHGLPALCLGWAKKAKEKAVQSEFLPSFFALAQRALAASEILFLAAADIIRVPSAFRGLPLFAVLLPERAWMATTIRSRWSISSVRIASVLVMGKII